MAVLLPLSAPEPSSDPTPRTVGRLEQFAPVIIDFNLHSSVTAGIRSQLSIQNDRAAIRHDQTGPDKEHAGLAESDVAVIDIDQPRTLRN